MQVFCEMHLEDYDLTLGDRDEKSGSSFEVSKWVRRVLIGAFRDRMLLVQTYVPLLFCADCIASCNAGQKFLPCISAAWD